MPAVPFDWLELLKWLDAHAGAVQALAAIATLFLTLVLVGATLWYAKSANDQTRELRMARTAAAAPYVRLVDVDVEHRAPPLSGGHADDAWGMSTSPYVQLRLKLVNLGAGPAVRVRFEPRGLPVGVALKSDNVAPNIPGGGGTDSLEAVVPEAHYVRVMAAFPLSLPSELRYTDLLERSFITRFRLHLLRTEGSDGIEARFDDRMEWVFDSADSTRNL